MKKFTTFVAVTVLFMSLFGVTQANAFSISDGWTMDLSTYGAGTYTNIDHLEISGGSTVIQNFSNPFNLQNGDTFTESGFFNITHYFSEPGLPADYKTFTLGGKYLYIEALDLSGSVYNVTTAGFDYTFNPGVGTFKMYLDDDLISGNSSSGEIFLADLNLQAPSGGHNNGVLLGGAGVNGTTDLTGMFANTLAGVFFAEGLDFGSLPAGYIAFGLANTNNLVTTQSTIDDENARLVFQSSGQVNVAVVPEPSTFLLLGAGLLGLGFTIRRKK